LAKINPNLFTKLQKKLNLSRSHLYARIGETAVTHTQAKNIAALILASESGIDYIRFASPEELTAVQNARNQQAVRHPSPVANPTHASTAAVARRAPKKKARTAARRNDGKRKDAVFVVHGRDDNARKALSAFLGALHIYIIDWQRALRLTGKGSPYIGEVIDAGFKEARAIIVLLTPDDEAKLRRPFRKPSDSAFESRLTGQPRQNVIFEAGMAFGKYKDTTILVEVGTVRQMSDLTGVHTVRLTNAMAQRKQLVNKLKTVGVELDDTGDDWLNAGDFDS
jgi:predicted nucleotide-binding protein